MSKAIKDKFLLLSPLLMEGVGGGEIKTDTFHLTKYNFV